MRRFIEIVAVGILLVIPITKMITDSLTVPTGLVGNATAHSVGNEGTFVQLLFQWWWVLFLIALFIIFVIWLRRKASNYGGFGGQ